MCAEFARRLRSLAGRSRSGLDEMANSPDVSPSAAANPMKSRVVPRRLFAVLGLAALAGSVMRIAALDVATSTTPADVEQITPSSPTNPVSLPVGASDVLRLTKAKVGDQAILAFVEASEETYRLSSAQVIYLKEQGVSDQVLTLMLRQFRKSAVVTRAAPPTAGEQNVPPAPIAPTLRTNSPTAGVAQPATTNVQTVPVYSYSTVYVPPTVLPIDPYYDCYPYYYPYSYGYYGCSYPGVSFSFGFWPWYWGGSHYGGGIYYGGGGHPGGGHPGGGHLGGGDPGGGYNHGGGSPPGTHAGGPGTHAGGGPRGPTSPGVANRGGAATATSFRPRTAAAIDSRSGSPTGGSFRGGAPTGGSFRSGAPTGGGFRSGGFGGTGFRGGGSPGGRR